MRQRHTSRTLFAACAALLGATAMQAQNITGYRYWFNDDVASATTVTLAPTPVADTEVTLASASLPAGPHLATIQFRDADGHWGAPWTSLFVQRGATVNAVQHWFNDDAANATTTNVTPGAAPLITGPLNASSLEVGLHSVTVRTRDDRGQWSVPHTTLFARNGGMITGYEYWIDDAVADRTTGGIGPAGTVDLISALPINTTEGTHLFTIRFHDAEEGWSVPLSNMFSFTVGMDEIPGVSNYLLFPNPVSDQLALRLEADAARDLQLSVLDATGRTVQALGKWNVSGTMHRSWDLAHLAPGRYLLRIETQDRSFQLPFVKQ